MNKIAYAIGLIKTAARGARILQLLRLHGFKPSTGQFHIAGGAGPVYADDILKALSLGKPEMAEWLERVNSPFKYLPVGRSISALRAATSVQPMAKPNPTKRWSLAELDSILGSKARKAYIAKGTLPNFERVVRK